MNIRKLYFITTIFILVGLAQMNGGNPSNEILTKNTPDGTVIFIKPQKMKRCDGIGVLKDLEYDIVLASLSDSVSFTATLITEAPLKLDSVHVSNPGFNAMYPIERLYVEPKGKNWESRVRFYMNIIDFTELALKPGYMSLQWGTQPKAPLYRHNSKKWEKFRSVYNFACKVLEQNKR